VRTVRKDTLTELKKLKLPEDDTKRLEKEVQKIHDDYIKKLDSLGQQKQKDLMKA
jgi:ribosome recycling factor